MLNRSVVIVRPAQPFLEWAAGLDNSGLVPDPHGEQTVYLIPNYDDDVGAWEILEDLFPTIFESELFGWYTDDSAWPQDRSFAMFREWFSVELHSTVDDLCAYEIVDDEEDEE